MTKIITIVIVVILIFGCASTRFGSEKAIEGKIPKWAIERPSSENRKFFYFSGTQTHAYDRTLGFKQSQSNAIRDMLLSIQQYARVEFQNVIVGANEERGYGQHITDIVALVVNNIEIGGVFIHDQTYEKIEKNSHLGIEYFYNCYTQIRLSKSDYYEARDKAINKYLQQSLVEKNKKAEEFAKEVAKRLNKNLEVNEREEE